MTETTTIARTVDWTPLVRLRGGQIGRYLEKCLVTGKHRVQTYVDIRGHQIAPPSPGDNTAYNYTTWLLDDCGRCRGDRAESPQDYAGPA